MEKGIIEEAEKAALQGEQLSKEKDIYLYICAWCCMDLNIICNILRRSISDPYLTVVLDNIHKLLGEAMLRDDEEGDLNKKHLYKKVQQLLEQYDEEKLLRRGE